MSKKKFEYAVMLVTNDNEHRWVTSIENGNTAIWAPGENAKMFSRQYAQDLAFGLCVNQYPALVVEVPDYVKGLKNDEEV